MNAKKVIQLKNGNQDQCMDKKANIRLVNHNDLEVKQDSILEKVIGEKLLYPVYQSIRQINNGEVFAYEGLTRTTNSEITNIIELIDLANVRGKLGALDLLMMEECIRNFRGNGILLINMEAKSPEQVKEYIEKMIQISEEVGISPEKIGIEISEKAQWQEEGLAILKELKVKYKFAIAVDDFGVGYSNFALIRDLKPDIVKIDKSLVSSINQDKEKYDFLKLLVAFIQKLNMIVIYEGIENSEELSALKEIGIGYGQGYYFEKPRRHT